MTTECYSSRGKGREKNKERREKESSKILRNENMRMLIWIKAHILYSQVKNYVILLL